jgi:hypothetical protein
VRAAIDPGGASGHRVQTGGPLAGLGGGWAVANTLKAVRAASWPWWWFLGVGWHQRPSAKAPGACGTDFLGGAECGRRRAGLRRCAAGYLPRMRFSPGSPPSGLPLNAFDGAVVATGTLPVTKQAL